MNIGVGDNRKTGMKLEQRGKRVILKSRFYLAVWQFSQNYADMH